MPPTLVESNPVYGGEIGLEEPILLYFSQPMDRSTVEGALLHRGMQAQINWQTDDTLALVPSQPLTPDSQVSVEISTNARAANGLTLNEPVSLTFNTAGFLSLTQSLPAGDAREVDPTSAVVAAFNRPVVPLGAEAGDLPAAFTLDPAAEGDGEWINTSTYIFYPDLSLEGGKVYTVRLNPDLRSTNGSPLEEASSWSFSTALPRLLTVIPDPTGKPIPLDSAISLTFNQPMDPTSVERNFRLNDATGMQVGGGPAWSEDHTVFTYTPATLLTRDSVYTLLLDGQAQARGGTTLGTSLNASLRTIPPLGVLSSDPGPDGELMQYNAVVLRMSGPLETRGLENFVEISPRVPNFYAWFDIYERNLQVGGDFSPNAEYTLTLSPELADPWGSKLGVLYTLPFRTAPLQPGLIIQTGSDVIFMTGQDNAISAQATNMGSVRTTLGSVPLQNFFRMLGLDGYQERVGFEPPDARTWNQPLSLTPDQTQPVEIYLSPNRQALQPGLYLLKTETGGEASFYPYPMVVSNIHLTFKHGSTDALVWAVDLRNGQPVSGATVTIYDEDGSQLASGQTDEQGVFQGELPVRKDPYRMTYAMLGQPGEENFSLAADNWSSGVASYDLGIPSERQNPQLEAYLYTDRPVYRPGQTVYFRGVVRQAFNGRYDLPGQSSVSLSLYGASGTELTTLELPVSAFGTVHGEYQLSPDAQPGYYSLGGKDDLQASLGFQVANYRKPEINLQTSFTEEQAQGGQSLEAQVSARYFFDAPAGDVQVRWALYKTPEGFSLPGYQVGLEDTRWLEAFIFPFFGEGLGELVAEGEARTQPDGSLSLTLPGSDFTVEERTRFTLEATATDESGQPVSARDSVIVHPSMIYIGVAPDAWVGQSGIESGYNILAVDWQGEPDGAHDLRAEFEKVTWTRQDPPPGSYSPPTYVPEYTPIASTDFRTNDEGQARVAFTPPEPGTYILRLSGENARTEMVVWVGGAGQAAWPNLPNQRLRLTGDRGDLPYRPGDAASVFIPNPFGIPTQALVTVERGAIMRHQVINVDATGSSLELPLSNEDAPNVFVSVTMLGQTPSGDPDFRQGYLELTVDPQEFELQVTLIGEPQRAGPGDEVSFEILVTDPAGNPVQGEFSLAVVDLAALALAPPNAPDILPALYGRQYLGVQNSLSLAAYGRRLVNLPGGMGGGGGEAMLTVAREYFPDTAFWTAEIVTGPDGKAQVSLPLPDTLTTWQVEARGLTSDTRVGQAKIQIVSTKDLLVRPVAPRFLVVGDHAQVAAIVQNNTERDLQVDVSLQATNFNLDANPAATQRLSVAPGGRARVEWWGVASDATSADLVFQAQAGDLTDASRLAQGALPILRYNVPQTFRTAGLLDDAGEQLELVSLPRSFDPSGGNLNVELAPSLAATTLSALKTLEESPCKCNEQLVSRVLSTLSVHRSLQDFGMQSSFVEEQLAQDLKENIPQLLARQSYDGGWSWWENGQSDPYISAYVLYGLMQAKEAGALIDAGAIQRAVDYLNSTLVSPRGSQDAWELDRQAFQHFALASAGAGSTEGLEALLNLRARLSPWGQALLALGIDQQIPGSEATRTLLSDLSATATRSATGAHWELSEPGWENMVASITNNAMVVFALAQQDPGAPLLADAVRYLASTRQSDGSWGSSFATAWTLMALTEVMRGTGELGGDFTFGAQLNSAPLASGQAGGAEMLNPVESSAPISSLYADSANALSIQRGEGSGRLYYTVGLQVNRPVEQVTPMDNGLSIARLYFAPGACPGESCVPLNIAQAEEKVQVRITLTLPQSVYNLMIEDYIPAGAEILDTSLQTSQLGLDETPIEDRFDPQQPFSNGWGWWWFSSPRIYDNHIAWAADYLPAGTYELTYTLVILQPGEYRVLPARAWQLYFPEVQAISAGEVFEIK
jgi:hypothetical protein